MESGGKQKPQQRCTGKGREIPISWKRLWGCKRDKVWGAALGASPVLNANNRDIPLHPVCHVEFFMEKQGRPSPEEVTNPSRPPPWGDAYLQPRY